MTLTPIHRHCLYRLPFVLQLFPTVKERGKRNVEKEKQQQMRSEWWSEWMPVILATVICILLLVAKDIAMLIINSKNECSLDTEEGESEYVIFDLNTWMVCGASSHILMVCSLALVLLIAPGESAIRRFCWCILALIPLFLFIFLFAWTVIGFLLQEEIRTRGVNNEQCDDILLAWLILEIVVEFASVCCVCCVCCWKCAMEIMSVL